jgi:hypothetical protein
MFFILGNAHSAPRCFLRDPGARVSGRRRNSALSPKISGALPACI